MQRRRQRLNYSTTLLKMIPVTPVAAATARVIAAPVVSLLAQKALTVVGGSFSAASNLPTQVAFLAPTLLVRGGSGPAEAPFDLTRARIRLEGLHSYGVVTTLMLNASLRLFSSTPRAKEGMAKGEAIDNAAKLLFTALIASSVISGLYTTVVFSLIGMYSKTAIGLNKDVTAFFQATQGIRDNAFHAFIVSLLSFNSSFILSLFLNYKGTVRWWVAGAASALSLISWWQWNCIMHIASQLIFAVG